MEKTFRDILRDFLEEKPVGSPSEIPASPSQKPIFPSEIAFQWRTKTCADQSVKARAEYKVTPKPQQVSQTTRPAKAPRPSKPEVIIPLEKLPLTLRKSAQELIDLGGAELKSGLSEERLKRAHRRLAKRFHPDGGHAEASARLFHRLQECYKALAKSLTKDYAAPAA